MKSAVIAMLVIVLAGITLASYDVSRVELHIASNCEASR